jgi:hypothetical protein
MGWSGITKPSNIKEYFIDQFEGERYTVLDCALVKRLHLYMAVRDNTDKRIFAVTILLRFNRAKYGETEMWYKDMTEDSGPNMFDCPKSILERLTPTKSEFANNWREANWNRQKKKKSLTTGMKIQFKEAVEFMNGWREDTFTVENAKRLHFRGKSGSLFKMSRSCINNNKWVELK